MSNEKTSTADATQLTVSEMRKDPDVRSRPLNEIVFDTAMSDKKDVETNKKSASGTDDKKAKDAKDDETINGSGDALSEDDDGQPKKSKGLEKKFKKLTAERTDLKNANDALMARLAALEEKVTGKTDNKSVVKQNADDFKFDVAKPKLGDFKDIVEYNEAVSDWNYDRREAQKEAKQAVTKQKETSDKLFTDFFKKGSEIEKELGLTKGEFEATVRDEDFKISPNAAVALAEMDGDTGNRIIWQIASDDDTRDQFNSMSPAKQLTFIGKLEAKLEATKDSKSNGGNGFSKAPVSKSKSPGKDIKGSSNATKFDTSKSVRDLAGSVEFKTQADYRRYRAQNKK